MRKKKAKQHHPSTPVFIHIDKLISRKRSAKKDSTANLYRATTNWLLKF